MTENNYQCDVCEDTGKVTNWIRGDGGNLVDDGERDCHCILEAVEEARGENLMEIERGN